MIVIIRSHIAGFYSYCLAPVSYEIDIHVYTQKFFASNLLFVDFNLSAEEIGQILGGN